ncbi:hypothetical protein [uncultured Cohaesibacter sp.]|uniref:hypothetical protein n=1 Tax=uncultured Cohaesibacter sp. TaxID=1002546 RepID=UPI002AAC1393|nr:hypothetical protein [uncultured Cohaesibacter sp.]
MYGDGYEAEEGPYFEAKCIISTIGFTVSILVLAMASGAGWVIWKIASAIGAG